MTPPDNLQRKWKGERELRPRNIRHEKVFDTVIQLNCGLT